MYQKKYLKYNKKISLHGGANSSDPWTCARCNIINESNKSMCEVCTNPRVNEPIDPSRPQSLRLHGLSRSDSRKALIDNLEARLTVLMSEKPDLKSAITKSLISLRSINLSPAISSDFVIKQSLLPIEKQIQQLEKMTSITCVKGKLSKKVTALKPKCPAGYKKK
jgi:hypothetical protein